MSVNENGNPRPNGFSASLPLGRFGGIGGTYYRNPGSPTAPRFTLTGSLGMGGAGLRSVFLRKGMTSSDTLGYGANANVGLIPSVGVNVSIPDENGVPQPWNAKVSSVEAGVGPPGFAGTYTATPQQIADFLAKYIDGPSRRAFPLRKIVAKRRWNCRRSQRATGQFPDSTRAEFARRRDGRLESFRGRDRPAVANGADAPTAAGA